jgi:hypothetical protein
MKQVLALGRELRLSYLPPLMVYMAAGISGLTAIVGTFFVKDHLGLSAAFLAGLAFWAGIPYVIKMPIGHVVDLIWRWKNWLVFLGAGLMTASLAIMVGLLTDRAAMAAIMPAESWFVFAELLAPVGFVIQDVVADAMTIEAVPRVDDEGRPVDPAARKLMNTTVQTLGRVAIISGTVVVGMINLYVFSDADQLSNAQKAAIYRDVYLMSLSIPVISVAGVVLAFFVRQRDLQRLVARGIAPAAAKRLLDRPGELPAPNWWILGGSLVFVVFTLAMGFGDLPYNQEIIFAGSFAIVAFLIGKLTRELEPGARATLIGTAVIIFAFRAVPAAGQGLTWWMIDALKFDEHFLAVLSLIGSAVTLAALFVFRRFMAERSIAYIVGCLAILGAAFSLPIVGMYYGLHHWTAALTGGLVDARFIVVVNTALDSPLFQISMIPMLAWIANSAPANLKATYFAIMASFTNLALSASQLGTKYLNQVFVVTREVRDAASGALRVPADYSQLGDLLIAQLLLTVALPFGAILLVRALRLKWA